MLGQMGFRKDEWNCKYEGIGALGFKLWKELEYTEYIYDGKIGFARIGLKVGNFCAPTNCEVSSGNKESKKRGWVSWQSIELLIQRPQEGILSLAEYFHKFPICWGSQHFVC